jgi:hypothetical protein
MNDQMSQPRRVTRKEVLSSNGRFRSQNLFTATHVSCPRKVRDTSGELTHDTGLDLSVARRQMAATQQTVFLPPKNSLTCCSFPGVHLRARHGVLRGMPCKRNHPAPRASYLHRCHRCHHSPLFLRTLRPCTPALGPAVALPPLYSHL